MHLGITQGGGISNVFPPAIASILPMAYIREVELEYNSNPNNPSEWRMKRIEYTSNITRGAHFPFGASLKSYSEETGTLYHEIAPLYIVDTSNIDFIYVKFLTNLEGGSWVGTASTYIFINPAVIISSLTAVRNDNTVWEVYGIPLYAYDKTTFQEVPLDIVYVNPMGTTSQGHIAYYSYVRCNHPEPNNVIVAASRELRTA